MNNKNNNKKIVDLSVVIPVYNEEEVLEELFKRLNKTLNSLRVNYEVIFIDDGSRDKSLEIITDFNQKDSRYKYISFSRNFGHQIAISAGIDFAEGKAVVIMDADLQDPPELIPEMLAKWKKGAEVVYAKRKAREKGYFLKSLTAKYFYRFINKLSPMKIPEDTGDFRLMDRKAVLALRELRETSRYMRGLSVWIGFKQDNVLFEREERYGGKTHYPLSRMVKFAMDGITSFSIVPLRLATYLGLICAFLGFLGGLLAIIAKFVPGYTFTGWATIVVAIFFLGGVQLIILGVIGEYIGRIYTETQNRPLYIIDKKKGFN